MFQLQELQDINQMEWEMCQYLDWEPNIKPSMLKEFEAMICKNFAGPGLYPTYVLTTISELTATSTNPLPQLLLTRDRVSFRRSAHGRLRHQNRHHLFPKYKPTSSTPTLPHTLHLTLQSRAIRSRRRPHPPFRRRPQLESSTSVKIVSHDSSPSLLIAHQVVPSQISGNSQPAYLPPSSWPSFSNSFAPSDYLLLHMPALDSTATICILALLVYFPHHNCLSHITALDLGIGTEIEPRWQLAWSDIAFLSRADECQVCPYFWSACSHKVGNCFTSPETDFRLH